MIAHLEFSMWYLMDKIMLEFSEPSYTCVVFLTVIESLAY